MTASSSWHGRMTIRIVAALPAAGPPDVLHGMARKLKLISDRRPGDIEVAKWIYEYNPCSYCRNGAFDRLVKRDALSKCQLAECVWDAYDDTRESARRLMKERRGDRA